jgi:hypothetical protein
MVDAVEASISTWRVGAPVPDDFGPALRAIRTSLLLSPTPGASAFASD